MALLDNGSLRFARADTFPDAAAFRRSRSARLMLAGKRRRIGGHVGQLRPQRERGAVHTTFGALRAVLDAGSGDREVFLQEVRAVLLWPSFQDLASAASGPGVRDDVAGLATPVDLSQLVQGIVISPGASRWLLGLVESVMRRYGLPRVPIASEVSATPEW